MWRWSAGADRAGDRRNRSLGREIVHERMRRAPGPEVVAIDEIVCAGCSTNSLRSNDMATKVSTTAIARAGERRAIPSCGRRRPTGGLLGQSLRAYARLRPEQSFDPTRPDRTVQSTCGPRCAPALAVLFERFQKGGIQHADEGSTGESGDHLDLIQGREP